MKLFEVQKSCVDIVRSLHPIYLYLPLSVFAERLQCTVDEETFFNLWFFCITSGPKVHSSWCNNLTSQRTQIKEQYTAIYQNPVKNTSLATKKIHDK